VQKYAVWKRPYGLPEDRTFVDYLADPVCHLSLYNYKIAASIGKTVATVEKCVTVLDTGSGPNLIKSSLLTSDVLRDMDTTREIVNLRGAGGHRLKVRGLATLTVKIGNTVVRQPFIVVDALGADAILGTTFIDEHIEALWIRKRRVIFRNGEEFPIQKLIDNDRPSQDLMPTKEAVVEDERPAPRVRLTHSCFLPPGMETAVSVQMDARGDMVMESWPRLYEHHQVTLSNGVVSVRPNVPFVVRVANFGTAPVKLTKNQIVGFGIAVPAESFVLDLNQDDPNESVGLSNLFSAENTTGTVAHGLKKPKMTTNDIDLSKVPEEQRTAVRERLKEYEKLWDGHLGQASGVHHRIPLATGSAPFRLPPFRAGPMARKVEKAEIEAMQEAKVIRPTQSEFASPLLVIPKKDGKWRACVDYRRLNALSVKDSYPLPRMDECLDSLGHAQWFTTLDANSGYW